MTRISQTRCRRAAMSALCAVLMLGGMLVPSHARSLAEIKKSRELRVCMAAVAAHVTIEPPGCKENCKFTGLLPEETLAFAQTLGNGIPTRFVRMEWDEQFFNKEGKTVRDAAYTPELLASGKCDLYPLLTKNEWRLKKLDFVILTPGRLMVLVSKPMKTHIKTAADLAGKTAATLKDTTYHSWLQEQNQTAYAANPVKIELMNSDEGFAAVEAGKVDFILASSHEAIWAARHRLKNATAVFPVGPVDEIGWAFRKDDKDLQAAVQKFFDEQRKNSDSELNRIWKNHFGRTLTEFIALMAAFK